MRLEDERLVTGRGVFTDDVVADGALRAVFVRSPRAHADIRSIGIAMAMQVDGAELVLTGADLDAANVKPIPIMPRLTDAEGRPPAAAPWPVLAIGRVRHVGQCVAVCIAQTEAAALRMSELVDVDYAPLAAVSRIQDALADGAPQIWPGVSGNIAFRWGLGDAAAVATAFAQAEHVVEVQRTSQRIIACMMEPRAAVARFDPADITFYLHTGNQGMTIVRDQVAEMLGVDKHRVVVTSRDVGGGFGVRNGVYPEYPALLFAARQLGRAVRWTATRSEAFVSDAQARDSEMVGRMALDRNGIILALEARATAAMGAFLHPVGYFIACANFARCLAGPYRIKAVRSDTVCVLTNTVPTAPYRGAGRPEAAYLTESLIESAAGLLGIDPIELRRRNMISPAEMPYRTAVGTLYDSGDFPAVLDKALAAADWVGSGLRKVEAKSRGKLRGIGVGLFVEISGGVPNERAQMTLAADGRVHVRTALGATGQGHETVFAMMAAEQLGVPADRVVIAQGDSRGFEDGGGSSASRSTTMAGLAMRATAQVLIARAREAAAQRMQVEAGRLVYENGRFAVPDTNLAIGLDQVAAESAAPIFAEARIEAEPTFPNGCHVAEIEIDPDTGQIQIVGYVAVDDCGRVIAHELAEGQVHGALAQGIGQALLEDGFYDRESGQLTSGSFMDYAVPRADDLPRFKSFLAPVPAATNPLGVKGLAEGGTVGALPALSNALLDALRPLGVEAIAFPATPYRIWRAIEDARIKAARP